MYRKIVDENELIHAKVVSEVTDLNLNECYIMVRDWNDELIEEGVIKRKRRAFTLAQKVMNDYGVSIKAINNAIDTVNKEIKKVTRSN
ncbi:MAG: hypothetical protein ACK5LC_18620 [Coprobacillaceae bacterium]